MSSNEEKLYLTYRPLRAWTRERDGMGNFKSDVAFAVGQTWKDEVPRWFNVSLINTDDRTTVESSELLPEGTTEDDLMANGYYRETVGGMLDFVQTLAGMVEKAENLAEDNYAKMFEAELQLEELRKSFNDTIGAIVNEFCMMSNQVGADGIRRKVFYVPATGIDVLRFFEGDENASIAWDRHEIELSGRTKTWEFKGVTLVEGKTIADLKALGASETSLTDWMAQSYHTAKDLDTAHAEIDGLRTKIKRILESDDRAAGERAIKTLEKFAWVKSWVGGSEESEWEYRSAYILCTSFDADAVAAGRMDVPFDWHVVTVRRSASTPGAQWAVCSSRTERNLTVEMLEGGGAEAYTVDYLRSWLPIWAGQVAIGNAKSAHPSQWAEEAMTRINQSELETEVEYWKAKAEEAEAREKAFKTEHADRMRKLVDGIIEWADSNDLDSPFDDFLESRGAVERPRNWAVSVEVPVTLEFTVDALMDKAEAAVEAARYVEEQLRGINDVAGMEVVSVGAADVDVVEVTSD
jgi:hypothetical protein